MEETGILVLRGVSALIKCEHAEAAESLLPPHGWTQWGSQQPGMRQGLWSAAAWDRHRPGQTAREGREGNVTSFSGFVQLTWEVEGFSVST